MKKPLIIGSVLLVAGIVGYMIYKDYQKKKIDSKTVTLDEALQKIAQSKASE
jgi:predicted negative regulator of RcsB-dependent stress response